MLRRSSVTVHDTCNSPRAEDRLTITWDETEGPMVEDIGTAGFGSRLLQAALTPFDGKTEIAYLKTGVHCTMQCRVPAS